MDAAALGRKVNEAESRHYWDAILYRFLVAPGETISQNILLERTLRYPRNTAADNTDSEMLRSSQLAMAETYRVHCSVVQGVAVTSHSNAFRQALAALIQADSFLADVESLENRDLLDVVKNRAVPEPRTGTCDAIFVTPVHLGDSQEAEEAKEYLNTFSLMEQAKPSSEKTPELGIIPFAKPSHLSPAMSLPKTLTLQHKKILRNPLQISSNKVHVPSSLLAPKSFVLELNTLLLSGFVAEYKKLDGGETKSLNQERIYLVSVVTHLATLGIKGFAVFGLLTSGKKGGILMAWQSKIDDIIYIIERNICTFDLSNPIEAFQFATFLIRVREHTEQLKDLFNENKAAILEKVKRGEFPKWTKIAQMDENRKEAASVRNENAPVVVVEGTAKDR